MQVTTYPNFVSTTGAMLSPNKFRSNRPTSIKMCQRDTMTERSGDDTTASTFSDVCSVQCEDVDVQRVQNKYLNMVFIKLTYG